LIGALGICWEKMRRLFFFFDFLFFRLNSKQKSQNEGQITVDDIDWNESDSRIGVNIEYLTKIKGQKSEK
jgi:hypothetical protein